MKRRGTALNPHRVMVSREDARRVDRFVMRVGLDRAAMLLGVGASTLEAACDQGRMMPKTHVRLFAALDAAEAA